LTTRRAPWISFSRTACSTIPERRSDMASSGEMVGGVNATNVDILSGNVGVFINPQDGQSAYFGFFQDVQADSSNGRAWHLEATGTGVLRGITATNCWAASSQTAEGILLTSSASGTLDAFRWVGGKIVTITRAGFSSTAAAVGSTRHRNAWANVSDGVRNAKVLRGRSLSRRATR